MSMFGRALWNELSHRLNEAPEDKWVKAEFLVTMSVRRRGSKVTIHQAQLQPHKKSLTKPCGVRSLSWSSITDPLTEK